MSVALTGKIIEVHEKYVVLDSRIRVKVPLCSVDELDARTELRIQPEVYVP